jgi:hypothetical protein
MVMCRCNLRSPITLSSSILSSLPSAKSLSLRSWFWLFDPTLLGLYPHCWIVSYYQVTWRGSVCSKLSLLVSPGLGSRPSPLLSVHQVTLLCHILTWSLLSILWGWYSTTFILPPFCHPVSELQFCVPGRYLSLDIGPPPQPRQDGAALHVKC